MSKQTVFRVAKNKDNPYVMLNKSFLEHPELSYRAKGILSYILSKPDHWRLAVSDLIKHGKEGRDAIYSTLKELIRHGFMQHICHRKNGKITHYEYIVYEKPLKTPIERVTYTSPSHGAQQKIASLLPGNPETASPDAEETLSLPLHPDIPESATPLDITESTLLPGNLNPEIPTPVINDLNKELINNKTSSVRAHDTISELWQEVFKTTLSAREHQALLRICSRPTLVKNICLIQEHHNVASILSPYAFVLSCVTGDGYKVPKQMTQPAPRPEKKHVGCPLP